jgi:hypothetical protein
MFTYEKQRWADWVVIGVICFLGVAFYVAVH